jgi:hypothetical protein
MTVPIPAIGTIDDPTQVRVALVRGQRLISAPGQALLSANVIDEDDMASDSDTKVPTQQSVNARINQKTPFALQSDADGATIDSGITHASTVGYAAIDDGGGAEFAFTDTDPDMPGGWSPADGRFAEIVPAARYKPSPFGILPEDTGAAALIMDVADWMERRRGGGLIEFLPNESGSTGYHINETITINYNGVSILGAGSGDHSQIDASSSDDLWTEQGTTLWKWTGTDADKMVICRPKVDTSGRSLNGGTFGNIVLEGAGVASHCLELLSLRGWHFPKLVVSNAVTANLHLGVVDDGDISSSEPRDLQNCLFDQIISRSWITAALGAKGILVDGDDVADVSLCHFGEIRAIHKNGHALDIGSSDTLKFGGVYIFRVSGGTGNGVVLRGGSSTADYPRDMIFEYISPGAGGLVTVANTVPPKGIKILKYSIGNGSPSPTISQDCDVEYQLDHGNGIAVRSAKASAIFDRSIRADYPGPQFELKHHDARGYNSNGDLIRYSNIMHYAWDGVDGEEKGRIYLQTTDSDGTAVSRGFVAKGLHVGSSTVDPGSGNISVTGSIQGGRAVTPDADGRTITAAETGTLFSATAKAVFNLPAAATGLRYGFYVADGDGIDVVAASGATIRIGTAVSSTARTATATALGSCLWLTCLDGTNWFAEPAPQGTWTLT